MPERVGESGEALHSTLVLMPAFNEGPVIGSVIREVQDACACPVVVIDDASTDDTIARAEAAGADVIVVAAELEEELAQQDIYLPENRQRLDELTMERSKLSGNLEIIEENWLLKSEELEAMSAEL